MSVKQNWLWAGAVVAAGAMISAGVSLRPVRADQAAGGGTTIACLNVKKCFDKYAKFSTLKDQLKADFEQKEAKLKDATNVANAKRKALAELKNPADRDRIEKEIADMQFELQKNQQKFTSEVLQHEAEIYTTVYKELTDAVDWYCKKANVHMVLQMEDVQPAEGPNARAALVTMLNRQVVWCHPNLDMTETVTQLLNDRMKAAAK